MLETSIKQLETICFINSNLQPFGNYIKNKSTFIKFPQNVSSYLNLVYYVKNKYQELAF
jgi:hypothetical protein